MSALTAGIAENDGAAARSGPWRVAWRRLRANATAIAGLILLTLILLLCFGAPLYLDRSADVIGIDMSSRLQGPSPAHLFGTDELGRDILSRVLWGGRISLAIGIGSVAIAGLIGTALGAIAPFYGGVLDDVLMRLLDVLMAVPAMLLMITFVAIMPPTQTNLMLAVSVSFVPGMARLVRAQVLSILGQEYVDAAAALGASNLRVIAKHVLPNAISPIIAQMAMNIPASILTISGLGFIGLGVQPPDPEWGTMLASGRAYIRDAWHITAFPGLAIVTTIIAFTLSADGLRDILDPRMKD